MDNNRVKSVEKSKARRKPSRPSREEKVSAGLADFEKWLQDLVYNGYGVLQTQPITYWERAQSRLVDAQATGISKRLGEVALLAKLDTQQHKYMIEMLGKIYIAIEAYKRIDSLPADLQTEIKTYIGWSQKKNELSNITGIRDTWIVMGYLAIDEDRLRTHRYWLYGKSTNRFGLLLDYTHGKHALETEYEIGTYIDAELAFYPGSYPLRAIIKEQFSQPEIVNRFPAGNKIIELIHSFIEALSLNPWITTYPYILDAVIPARLNDEWWLLDADGYRLPIHSQFQKNWELLSISGGDGILIFGEWDGYFFWPLNAVTKHTVTNEQKHYEFE